MVVEICSQAWQLRTKIIRGKLGELKRFSRRGVLKFRETFMWDYGKILLENEKNLALEFLFWSRTG